MLPAKGDAPNDKNEAEDGSKDNAEDDGRGDMVGLDNAVLVVEGLSSIPLGVGVTRGIFLTRKAKAKAEAGMADAAVGIVAGGSNDGAAANARAATRANEARARYLERKAGGVGVVSGNAMVSEKLGKAGCPGVSVSGGVLVLERGTGAPSQTEPNLQAQRVGEWSVLKGRKFVGGGKASSERYPSRDADIESMTKEARDAFYLRRKAQPGVEDNEDGQIGPDRSTSGAVADVEDEQSEEGGGREGVSPDAPPNDCIGVRPGAFQVDGIISGADVVRRLSQVELPSGGVHDDGRAPVPRGSNVPVFFLELFESFHRRFTGRCVSSDGCLHGRATGSELIRNMASGAPLVEGINVVREEDPDTAGFCVGKSRRWRKWAVIGLFVVGLVAGAAGLALTLTKKRTVPSSDAADLENRNVPTPFPTSSPEDAKLSVRFQIMARIVEAVSDRDTIIDSSSAQHRTLAWLADDDKLQLSELEDDEVIIQRYVVALLYFALGGVSWTDQKRFLSGQHECEWGGNNCNGFLVAEILLNNNNVTGVLPKEIFSLNLSYLSFTSNNLFGSLPSQVKNLGRIDDVLNLGFNDLTGTIPTWINRYMYPTLKRLDMTENKFTGRMPLNLTALSALKMLSLYGNQLTGDISTFTAFNGAWLIIGENNFTGTLPPQLAGGASSRLELLGLFDLDLTGTIPPSYFEMQHLVGMDMSDNRLTGTLPRNVRTFNLRGLGLEGNNLSGIIPSSFGKLSKLEGVNMHSNRLSGTLPSEMGNLTTLKFLELGNNKLSGSLPESFRNLTSLLYLSLRSNKLEGSFDQLCDLSISLIYADCGGGTNTSSIHCSCCSICCKDESMKTCGDYPSSVAFIRSCVKDGDSVHEACRYI